MKELKFKIGKKTIGNDGFIWVSLNYEDEFLTTICLKDKVKFSEIEDLTEVVIR